MSTIEEMKAERLKTENLITDLLKAFEDKYVVEVSSVYLTRTQNMGERQPKLRHVTLEVKI
jgi:hypothetical protein